MTILPLRQERWGHDIRHDGQIISPREMTEEPHRLSFQPVEDVGGSLA
jgi:hypothetical protein